LNWMIGNQMLMGELKRIQENSLIKISQDRSD